MFDSILRRPSSDRVHPPTFHHPSTSTAPLTDSLSLPLSNQLRLSVPCTIFLSILPFCFHSFLFSVCVFFCSPLCLSLLAGLRWFRPHCMCLTRLESLFQVPQPEHSKILIYIHDGGKEGGGRGAEKPLQTWWLSTECNCCKEPLAAEVWGLERFNITMKAFRKPHWRLWSTT